MELLDLKGEDARGPFPAGPGMPWCVALSSASPSEWKSSGIQDSWGLGEAGAKEDSAELDTRTPGFFLSKTRHSNF